MWPRPDRDPKEPPTPAEAWERLVGHRRPPAPSGLMRLPLHGFDDAKDKKPWLMSLAWALAAVLIAAAAITIAGKNSAWKFSTVTQPFRAGTPKQTTP